jgi:hypothetical protein
MNSQHGGFKSAPKPNQSNYSKDLLKYFWPFPYPEHLPPNQVVFSNGLPESDHDPDHMIFQMAYSHLIAAIQDIVESERSTLIDELEAKLPENPLTNARIADEDMPKGKYLQLKAKQQGFNNAITEVKAILEEFKK